MAKAIKAALTRDNLPNQLAEKVVPVIDVHPDHNRIANVVVSDILANGTSATLYTTPTDRDFYLTSATLSTIKDATSTSTASAIEITPQVGLATKILSIVGLTLTAQNFSIATSFNCPILLKRGSSINITNSTNVANITSRAAITGYIVEG